MIADRSIAFSILNYTCLSSTQNSPIKKSTTFSNEELESGYI